MHTIGRYLSRTFVTKRSFAAIATGSLAIYSTVDANSHCDAAPVLRMKGGAILAADVGGTNSRLMLYKVLLSALSLSFSASSSFFDSSFNLFFQVDNGAPIEKKQEATGTLIFSKTYANFG